MKFIQSYMFHYYCFYNYYSKTKLVCSSSLRAYRTTIYEVFSFAASVFIKNNNMKLLWMSPIKVNVWVTLDTSPESF